MTLSDTQRCVETSISDAVNLLLQNDSWVAEWIIGKNKNGVLIELCGSYDRLRAWIPKISNGKYIENQQGTIDTVRELTWGCSPIVSGETWIDLDEFINYLENLEL